MTHFREHLMLKRPLKWPGSSPATPGKARAVVKLIWAGGADEHPRYRAQLKVQGGAMDKRFPSPGPGQVENCPDSEHEGSVKGGFTGGFCPITLTQLATKRGKWDVSFWLDRGIKASKVPVLLPCVHGSTAVLILKAALKPRGSPGECQMPSSSSKRS